MKGRPAVRIYLAPLGRSQARGLSIAADRTVWVDPRKPWPAHTLLHELLHVRHPSWSETRVRKETARRWKKMSAREKARLLKMFGHAIIKEEVDE